MADTEAAIDLMAQEIILAASKHEVATLRGLLRSTSSAAPANVKDAETGYTPLHAAIASMERDGEHDGTTTGTVNGDNGNTNEDDDEEMARAVQTVQYLLQNGAIWNALDARDETPGCLAWRLGLRRLYDAVVDAGVRAELLFQRLDGYEPLEDDDGDDDEDDENEGADGGEAEAEAETVDTTTTAAAAAEGETANDDAEEDADASLSNANFLRSRLTFSATRVLDSSANAVMMDWERSIMQRTVDALLPTTADNDTNEPLTVLNIGHGLGVIDTLLQERRPASHHIIEAHADVLARMNAPDGIVARSSSGGVTVHAGRWQDVLPRLAAEGVAFDAIFFDTFAEEYAAFRAFFEEWVVALLKQDGRWSFFHGLGADRRVCYDVYTKVVEMDLFEAGFDVEWEVVRVPDLPGAGEWEGVRRAYWALDEYRLPVCSFVG